MSYFVCDVVKFARLLSLFAALLLQIAVEKMEELESREATLKNEIRQLNEQMSQLHRQHADELDRLRRENAAEVHQLTEELSRQKESTEANGLERGRDSELIYYQRHLEAMEQIDELRDLVAERQNDVENLRENLQHRDAELEQLKANMSSHDTDDGSLIAAIQLDLERVMTER